MQAGKFNLYDIESIAPLIASGYTVLTPTARLARRIKAQWDHRQAAAGRRSWTPAPVMALESWLLSRYEQAESEALVDARTRLDAPRAQEIWLQVISADTQRRDNFHLLQPAAAAQLAATAREDLLRWQVNMDSEQIQSSFRLDEDCATFLGWLIQYNGRLARGGLETPAGCLANLVHAPLPRCGRVALLAFDDIPPLYNACIDRIVEERTEIPVPGDPCVIAVHSYADRSAELSAIASWAADSYRQNEEGTVGIVLHDMQQDRPALEHLLRREFDCLGEDYASLPVNFSTGITLDQAPVISSALSMLACGGDHLPLEDIVSLVQSRFSSLGDHYSEPVLALLRRLYRDGQEPVSLARLRSLARTGPDSKGEGATALGRSLGKLFELRLHRQRAKPSEWVETFCVALDAWGWPGAGPLDSLEYQQVERWYEALDGYGSYDQLAGEIDFSTALAMLRRCCESRISQPQTADARIQVLGPLEAAGLSFDSLWICGMEAGRFPAPARPNPLIPIAIQRTQDMPHASTEREWRFAETLFDQFSRGAGSLTASYSRFTDGTPNLPSPLLPPGDQLSISGDWTPPNAWLTAFQGGQHESLDDSTGPALSQEEREQLTGGSGLLEDQSHCPFRAFAKRRLALQTLDEPQDGLSAADRGNLVHTALYVFWGEVHDSAALAALDDSERRGRLLAAIDAAIEQLPKARRELAGGTCLDLERQRLLSVLTNWLSVEDSRDSFSVIAREEPLSATPGGLALELRVDRIDELATGQKVLIDYKSGNPSSASWYGDRPHAPQLPLYAVATDVDGISFASVKAREARFLGLGDVEGIPGVTDKFTQSVINATGAQDWESLRARWQIVTDELARDFESGSAAVDPLNGACRYCGLQALCRVQSDAGEPE